MRSVRPAPHHIFYVQFGIIRLVPSTHLRRTPPHSDPLRFSNVRMSRSSGTGRRSTSSTPCSLRTPGWKREPEGSRWTQTTPKRTPAPSLTRANRGSKSTKNARISRSAESRDLRERKAVNGTTTWNLLTGFSRTRGKMPAQREWRATGVTPRNWLISEASQGVGRGPRRATGQPLHRRPKILDWDPRLLNRWNR